MVEESKTLNISIDSDLSFDFNQLMENQKGFFQEQESGMKIDTLMSARSSGLVNQA